MLDLSIVIVNFNTCDLLRDCLNSIYRGEGQLRFNVVVVDNASPDRSAKMVEAEFPQVILITNQVNGGFAYANNQGLRQVGFNSDGSPQLNAPRYALLLNPDTLLPSTALADIVTFMDSHPEAGAVGPEREQPAGQQDPGANARHRGPPQRHGAHGRNRRGPQLLQDVLARDSHLHDLRNPSEFHAKSF